jgi:cytochrome c oxidase assembly protein subunit 15
MRGAVKWVAGLAAAGMFLVLLMGATVTSTGSGEGCGRSWPLCNGRFIPEFAVATAIEFSHRAVTGVEGVLILVASAGLWWYWRTRREVQVLVPMTLAFLFLQAGLGAWAVMASQSEAVLALHFGISLVAFASVLLAHLFVLQVDGPVDALRDRPIPGALRWANWGLLAYVYAVVYLGAYVRHSEATLACRDWPLCNGSAFPGFAGPEGIVFAHRLAAGLAVLAVASVGIWTWRLRAVRPDLSWASAAALTLILLQSLSGASVVLTGASLFSALSHSGLMALLFGSLSYLCLQSLRRPVAARERLAPRYASAPSQAS